MPDNREVTVTITRDPRNRVKCVVDPPHFVANPGDTITFKRLNIPEVLIHFRNGSPFQQSDVQSGSHPVTAKGPKTFEYDVRWVDEGEKGDGNGSGEVGGG
jgi:hypothetical protein